MNSKSLCSTKTLFTSLVTSNYSRQPWIRFISQSMSCRRQTKKSYLANENWTAYRVRLKEKSYSIFRGKTVRCTELVIRKKHSRHRSSRQHKLVTQLIQILCATTTRSQGTLRTWWTNERARSLSVWASITPRWVIPNKLIWAGPKAPETSTIVFNSLIQQWNESCHLDLLCSRTGKNCTKHELIWKQLKDLTKCKLMIKR